MRFDEQRCMVVPADRRRDAADRRDPPRVVCIPAHQGEEALLSATLHSVVAHTMAETPIVLVYAGPAAGLSLFLQATEVADLVERVQSIATDSDGCSLYLALRCLPARYDSHDVVYALPGVIVTCQWDARLALAAGQDSDIAAVSPMCDVSPLFALLDKEFARSGVEIDQLAYALSRVSNAEVPAVLCNCAYLRRAALNVVEPELDAGTHLELGAFCWTMANAFRLAGLHAVCCDHVYVTDHNRHHRQTMQEIAWQEEVELVNKAHPLTGLRHAVSDALAKGVGTGAFPEVRRQPVQLHVAHSWGGGLGGWVRDYCAGDTQRINLVLRSVGTWGAFGQRIALYRSHVMDIPLRCWDLYYPIRATAIANLQYQAILREIIAEFGVEVIIISSLIGHSLDLLETDVKTIFLTHDYYPFCPAVVIHFNEVCSECPVERLQRCLVENEQHRFFRNVPADEWLGIRRRFVQLMLANQPRITVVSPSESVPRYLKRLLPEFADLKFNIIEHGMNLPSAAVGRQLGRPSAKLRVVVLGSLALQKGKRLLEEVYPNLQAVADLYLVGCGEDGLSFEGKPGVQLIAEYEQAELAALMASIDPDLGLLLSVWPETFSYTLSELWLLGVPPVATQIGSFAERITEGVNGFFCEPTRLGVLEKLQWLAAHRAALDLVRTNLVGWTHRPVGDMIEAYHALTPLPAFSARRYCATRAAIPAGDSAVPMGTSVPVLVVAPKARFATVIQEFGQYVQQRLSTNPRFDGWRKKVLVALVNIGLRVVGAMLRMASPR